jgi:hypothetical protein
VQAQIDLYALQLEMPGDWTLVEHNRRPEPSGPFNQRFGHDCADYTLASPSGAITIAITPQCGNADYAIEDAPGDAVVVKEKSPGEFIIRYFDPVRLKYVYTNAGQPNTPTLTEGTQPAPTNYMASPPVITITGASGEIVRMEVVLELIENLVPLKIALEQCDRVIASLEIAPR